MKKREMERYFLIVGGKEDGCVDDVRRSGASARFDGRGDESIEESSMGLETCVQEQRRSTGADGNSVVPEIWH